VRKPTIVQRYVLKSYYYYFYAFKLTNQLDEMKKIIVSVLSRAK